MTTTAEKRRIETVLLVWHVLEKDLEATGREFYERMFSYAPEYLQLFSFREEPDLLHSDALKKHAARVMQTIGTALTMLQDLDHLVPILKQLGARHFGYGVEPEHYDTVGRALLDTFAERSGPEVFTEEARVAWTEIYGIVKNTMI